MAEMKGALHLHPSSHSVREEAAERDDGGQRENAGSTKPGRTGAK